MVMRNKTRAKGLQKSEQLLGAGAVAKEYGIGVIGPDPRLTTWIIVGVLVAVVAVVLLFFGMVIYPGLMGILLLYAVYGAIERPASVAVTNGGVAVLARSEFNGQPRKVLTVLPQGVLATPTALRSGGYVHLADLHLWFRKKEYERLVGLPDAKLAMNQWALPVPVGVAATMPGGPNSAATSPTFAAPPDSSPHDMARVPAKQPAAESSVIYCSWCGKERAVNAPAIHYCGSMERPTVYCMSCGTLLAGATNCTSCGTPATQLSK
jgi:hypothetical protein